MSKPLVRHYGELFALFLSALPLPWLLLAQLAMAAAPTASDQSAGAEPAIAEQRLRLEASIESIDQQLRDIATSTAAADVLPGLAETRRLLDRLLGYQLERLKRLDDLEVQSVGKVRHGAGQAVLRALAESPRPSSLAVEASRDELAGLQAFGKSIEAGLAVRETEKQEGSDQLRRATEESRLAAEKVLRARDAQPRTDAEEQQRLAELRRQVAEAKLATIAIDQEWLRREYKQLQAQIARFQETLAPAMANQQFTEADLELLRQRTSTQQRELGGEIDKITGQNLRHVKEREKLHKRSTAEIGATQAARREMLDQLIETDNARLQGLRGLQLLLGATQDAWETRFAAMTMDRQETRIQAVVSLRRLLAGLDNRQRLLQETLGTLREAIREQERRLSGMPQDQMNVDQENQILSLMRQRLSAYERVETAAIRLERQLTRWIDDLGAIDKKNVAARLDGFAGRIKSWLATLWHYELFAVESASEVDGRAITVTYGVTTGKSIGVLALLILGYWLVVRIARAIEKILVGHFGVAPQVARTLRRWLLLLLMLPLVIVVLNLARIPLTVFAFLGGALAIGVGFGTQNIIKNFISGAIILLERKIRVGDIIESAGVTGQVMAVDLRATTVRGFDGIEALIPNSNFLENQVMNWTYSSQHIRREIKVAVAYGSDATQVAGIFIAIATASTGVLRSPIPEVFLDDFGDSALIFSLVYWVNLGSGPSARNIDSALRHEILAGLSAAGIGIPFPQRQLHIASWPAPRTRAAAPAKSV